MTVNLEPSHQSYNLAEAKRGQTLPGLEVGSANAYFAIRISLAHHSIKNLTLGRGCYHIIFVVFGRRQRTLSR